MELPILWQMKLLFLDWIIHLLLAQVLSIPLQTIHTIKPMLIILTFKCRSWRKNFKAYVDGREISTVPITPLILNHLPSGTGRFKFYLGTRILIT